MGMTKLEILQLSKDLTDPSKVALLRGRKSSPGPLDQLFEKNVAHAGEANLVLNGVTHKLKFERYRSTRTDKFDGSLRLVFKHPQQPHKKQVHLEISADEFQILTLVDTTTEPLPHCDTGNNEIADPSATQFLANKVELEQAMRKGTGQVSTDKFTLRRSGQTVQAPIFRRPVDNPIPVETSRGQIFQQALPDFPLRDVKVFSQQALFEIITQIDPVIEHGRYDWYMPIELKPTLRPAQEIASLVVQNLGV